MKIVTDFIEYELSNGKMLDNKQIRNFCEQNGISFDDNTAKIKECVEIGLMHLCRAIAQRANKSIYDKYLDIIDLYNRQPYVGTIRTLSQMVKQQYSTALPIAYLMSEFVKGNSSQCTYFEPSAGNGFLTVALPQEQTICNEIDDFRLENLRNEHYKKVTDQDASLKFDYNRIFDGVVTNPPFVKDINTMIFNALDTMKDNGRCAILRDGLNLFEEYAGVRQRKSLNTFYDRLFSEYNVVKIINLNSKKIYAKQGTAFFMHIILIDGRKAQKTNDSIHRVFNPDVDKVNLAGFDELWQYFSEYFTSQKNTLIEKEMELLNK